MNDKFALLREAFEDAGAGVMFLANADLAADVDGAQQVINVACAVQTLRVAQYAGRTQPRRLNHNTTNAERAMGGT